MKATGIVRRIDDLGRVVIPKEIRRIMQIKEGDPSFTTLTEFDKFCFALHNVAERKNGVNSLRFLHKILTFKIYFHIIAFLLQKHRLS